VGHSEPKHGPAYTPPPDDGSSTPDPDYGQDLSSYAPNLAVPTPWSSPGPPSFNDDPPKTPAGDQPPNKDIPPCAYLQVNLASLRGGMNVMLAQTQTLVGLYDDLRLGVFGCAHTVFGQTAMIDDDPYGVEGASATDPEASPIQAQAQVFAAGMNPAQERVLEFAANAIELVGQFIAGVDRAGQVYGSLDRKAAFPPAPDDWLAKMSDGSNSS
jgi:hypothetical protein